jgi:hypothetical protein
MQVHVRMFGRFLLKKNKYISDVVGKATRGTCLLKKMMMMMFINSRYFCSTCTSKSLCYHSCGLFLLNTATHIGQQ